MKNYKRIIAFVLTIVMLACSFSFAADPTASIVSPAANSVFASDSLLVSVKLNNPCTVRITVYEEKIKVVDVNATASAISGAAVTAPAISAAAVTAPAISAAAITETAITVPAINGEDAEFATYASVSYKSVDTTSFEAIDFVSNPALSTYVDKIYLNPVTYTSTEKIGFYTKQLTGVKPGLYKIKVQVLDEKGKVTETVSSLIAIKAKPVVDEKVVFEQKQTGAIKVLQNLLKSIFK